MDRRRDDGRASNLFDGHTTLSRSSKLIFRRVFQVFICEHHHRGRVHVLQALEEVVGCIDDSPTDQRCGAWDRAEVILGSETATVRAVHGIDGWGRGGRCDTVLIEYLLGDGRWGGWHERITLRRGRQRLCDGDASGFGFLGNSMVIARYGRVGLGRAVGGWGTDR